jgi:hypothetical protein
MNPSRAFSNCNENMYNKNVRTTIEILSNALEDGHIVWTGSVLHISAQMWSITNCTCGMFSLAAEVEQTTKMLLQLTRATEVVYHIVGRELTVISLPPAPEGTHPINTYHLGDDCCTCLVIQGLPMSWTGDPMPDKNGTTIQP